MLENYRNSAPGSTGKSYTDGIPDSEWVPPLPSQAAIIDSRALERECLLSCLKMMSLVSEATAFASVEDWRRDRIPDRHVILFNLGSRSMMDDGAADEVSALVQEAGNSPVVVISRAEEIAALLAAVDAGAVGHIPFGAVMADVAEATRVALSGGVFLPRASIAFLRRAVVAETENRNDGLEDLFTDRQLAVARALQRGAANKTIAYELNLCESTVKVHIRNIMRKLNATNRTQAAFRLTERIGMTGKPG